ncbi:MAG TPA: hypothetical protein DET40_22335 [Lentisphaeria bacterium]|nr:MAG: hypothetical protein A2X45_24810 [Lentisphaerae bacterium GWF2_50_93]HCE46294.1 hypothetical protein [Lentisphaeria bacterium]
MYHCSKCGKDIEAPKDLTVRAARCQCGNMVSFSEAVTMVPQPASPQAASQAHSGEILIPGYRIVKKIGEGGMGSVFEAVQESLGRRVAIKVLPGKLASDPQFVKRFDREAGTLSQLRHPNIVGIIDRGSVNGTYYFVMEYIADKDGNSVTLYDLISQHTLSRDSILRFTREIAGALAYAHSKGIIHRDIKPSNILIDELSAARVVDFGIAQILGDEQNRKIHLTMTGEAIGTPQYMSPEQKTNASKSDARSDIYSLGVMVYEMLTGGFPEGAWDLPSEVGCDPKWDSIIENSIRKLPERRFQTMTDFLSSLDAIGAEPSVPKEATVSIETGKEERYRTPVPSTSILGKCPSCGVENSGDNRFCNGCGKSLYEACPACQGEIRVGLKFCGKCGVDIPKQKKINELKETISKALEAASVKKDDIVAATEILLDTVQSEDSLVEMSSTGNGNIHPTTVHGTLNSLWDEKALEYEIFPSSGTEHIEFLSRLSIVLPDRKDIQAKIEKLFSERDNLLEEIRRLYKNGHFLSLLQITSKSRWDENADIASIVSDAHERYDKAYKLVDSQIPNLIEEKRYYELNKVLVELEGLGTPIEGLSELHKETDMTLQQAKKLYEHAVKLSFVNKLPEAVRTLEKLMALCSDYLDASDLLVKINHKIPECLKHFEDAKKHVACKKYGKALLSLLSTYDSEEVKILYAEAVKGKDRMFKRNLIISFIAFLSVLSIAIIAFVANRQLTYNSYFEKANLALAGKEYDKAIELYSKALQVPGHQDEVSARNFLQEAMTAAQFNELMAEGKQYLEKKELTSAEKAFKDARNVKGYENDSEVSYYIKKCKNLYEAGIKQADLAKLTQDRENQFKSAMNDGKLCLNRKEWNRAETAFRKALAVPGYEDNKEAIDSIKEAKNGPESQRKQSEAVWDESRTEVNKLLSEAKNNSLNIARRIESADTAMALLQKISDSLEMSYLSDVSKTEIANLKSEIISLKPKLNPCPVLGNDWKIPDIHMEFIWIKALNCWIGKYEVTNGEYRMFKPEHNSKEYENITLNEDRQPVVFVNFDNSIEFAKWLTEREVKAGRLPSGYSYRLPTEREWTIFCQCGDKREYPWGNGSPAFGNYCGQETNGKAGSMLPGYNDGFLTTCPVEKSGKNDWGLYGVGGNVWECTISSSSNVSFDAWRGASWYDDDPARLKSSFRYIGVASRCNDNYGFRLVLSR